MRMFNLILKKSYNKYLFCFLLIICLFSIAYILIYQRYQNLIKNEINSNRCEVVSRIGKDIDQNVYEVLKLIYQSKDDSDLYKIDEKDKISHFDYSMIQRYIARNTIVNSFVEDIVFYIKDDNVIINKEGSFNFDQFFERYMINSSKNKYFWKEYLNSIIKPHNTGTIVFPVNTYETKVFPDKIIERDLAIFTADNRMFENMCFMVLINTDKIDLLCGSDFIIYDNDSKSIIYNSNKYDIDINKIIDNLSMNQNSIKLDTSQKRDYCAYYTKSSHYNWFYIKIIHEDIIYTGLESYNRSTIVIISLLFVTTVLLSCFFSKKLYKPIKKIVDVISPAAAKSTNNVSDTQKIYDYIDYTHDSYMSIEQKLVNIKRTCRESIYDRLIRIPDIYIDENILNELNIKSDSFDQFLIINYQVMYKNKFKEISFSEHNSYEKVNIVVKELIDATISDMNLVKYTFRIGINSYVSIVTINGGKFNRKLFENNIVRILKNDYEYFYIRFSVSEVYQGISNLKQACDQAIWLNQYCSLIEKTQFITSSKIDDIQKFHIPKKTVDKMKCLLELGISHRTKEYMTEIFEYFEAKETPLLHIKRYYVSVFNELFKLSDDGVLDIKLIDSLYMNLDRCEVREDFEKLLNNMSDIMYDNIECKKTYGHNAVDKMVQYINENYDKEIYLDMFANMFKLSPNYLSRLFKDSMGINYTEFVSKVRIRTAKSILEERKIRTKDLSAMVGYRDSNTFIKVFREHTGVSPGEYHKLKQIYQDNNIYP